MNEVLIGCSHSSDSLDATRLRLLLLATPLGGLGSNEPDVFIQLIQVGDTSKTGGPEPVDMVKVAIRQVQRKQSWNWVLSRSLV